MLKSLGIGWASSTLGFISIAMVPLPFILQRVSLSPRLHLIYSYLLTCINSMARTCVLGADSRTEKHISRLASYWLTLYATGSFSRCYIPPFQTCGKSKLARPFLRQSPRLMSSF
jgi:hypothetical protein